MATATGGKQGSSSEQGDQGFDGGQRHVVFQGAKAKQEQSAHFK
jgi:hypothetical protein